MQLFADYFLQCGHTFHRCNVYRIMTAGQQHRQSSLRIENQNFPARSERVGEGCGEVVEECKFYRLCNRRDGVHIPAVDADPDLFRKRFLIAQAQARA